jgi:DUF1680 family protein
MTSISKYIWDVEDGVLYANLFAGGEMTLPGLRLSVETAYPFGDTVTYTVHEGEMPMAIRIPGFSQKNYTVSVPGEYRDGYYYLTAKAGDVITVTLDMTPRLNRAHAKVARDSGLGAVTVGPVVYCAEEVDNGEGAYNFTLDKSRLAVHTETPEALGFAPTAFDLGQVYTVTAQGTSLEADDPDALYFTDEYREVEGTVKLIPYFMWGNRGLNRMRVWMPVR